MTTVDDIEALLAAEKTFLGQPVWRRDVSRPERAVLTAPLAVSGIGTAGLEVRAHATLHTTPQRGGIVLNFGAAIQRMTLNPDHEHRNGPGAAIPKPLRLLRLAPDRHRLHGWRLNRRWPRTPSDNLRVAEPVDDAPSDFAGGMLWFLQQCRIAGDLPAPPHEPRLL